MELVFCQYPEPIGNININVRTLMSIVLDVYANLDINVERYINIPVSFC